MLYAQLTRGATHYRVPSLLHSVNALRQGGVVRLQVFVHFGLVILLQPRWYLKRKIVVRLNFNLALITQVGTVETKPGNLVPDTWHGYIQVSVVYC